MTILQKANLLGVIVLTMMVTAAFVPNVWICDLLSQFRLVFTALLIVFIMLSVALRETRSILLSLLAFAINLVPVSTMFMARTPAPSDKVHNVSILNFNTQFPHNDQVPLLESLVETTNPDVITLVEVNQGWADGMKKLDSAYPFQKVVVKNGGLAIFSKYPLENIDVRFFGKENHPRISATICLSDQKVNLLLVHPTTPKTEAGFSERNVEFKTIAEESKAKAEPRIVIGDFNCGPWSPAFKTLLGSGLEDSEQGLGPQPSWPVRSQLLNNLAMLPLIPIDHVLTSKDVKVLERTIGPALHSDHLPVFIRLSVGKTKTN
jgi:endonuclease/exonuclease/phosphatase (EEP) superfamily protein YafD